MKYGVDMGSFAKIYIAISINIGLFFIKLISGIHGQHDDLINILLFFSK
jgi:hypothetical protein